MNKKRKIHKEIRQISHFRARKLARKVLMLLLLLMIFLFQDTPLYLLIALLLFPAAIDYIFRSAAPQKNQDFAKQAVLTETMKHYHFVYTKYCSESATALLAVLMLAIWQLVQPQSLWYGIPYWRIPGLLIAIYYLTETGLYFLFRWYIHHRFTHIHIS
jgi:hypothetical protein